MNLILIANEEIATNNRVTLRDRRSAHIINILRAQKGDTVRIGVINGPLGTGRIREITPSEVILEIDAEGPAPPAPSLDIILALPRPIMLKRILSQIAALGTGRLFLINANRVEKSFFNASLLKDNTLQHQLLHGLEQAMDTRMPQVSIHQRFRPFAEDFLPEIIDRYPCKLIAHPEAEQFLYDVRPGPAAGQTLLAIGPEGGWVDFEITKFQQLGLEPFTLGDRILRVDSAVPALIAQIHLLRDLKRAGYSLRR